MNDFTASNGIKIRVADGPSGTYLLGVMPTLDQTHATGSVEGIQALREFFQAEADERLSRWRHGDFVVYDRGDYVQVIHEPDGASGMLGSWTRAEVSGDHVTGSGFRDAARAYFDAHPEPKPPWRDAKPGDVWRFETADDRRHALGWVARDGSWDLMTPRGENVQEIADPLTWLRQAWGDEFESATATRFVPEVS